MTDPDSVVSRGVRQFEARRGSLGPRRSTKRGSSGSANATPPSSRSSSRTTANRTESGSTTLMTLVNSTVRAVYASTRSEQLATSALLEAALVLGEDRTLEGLSTLDIETLIAYYRAQGNQPATINRKLAVVSRMLSYGRHLGIKVPAIKIRKLKEPTSRTRVLTKQEQDALFETAESYSPSLAFFFRFLLATGCRVGEALKLQWSHIDFTRHWVRFEDTKGDLPRGVPIPESMNAVLLDLQRDGLRAPFADLKQSQVTAGWNRCRAKMGLSKDPEFVPHSLRHTCATELVAAGVSIQVIQRWLGHRTLSMTQRYAHVHDEMLISAMGRRA